MKLDVFTAGSCQAGVMVDYNGETLRMFLMGEENLADTCLQNDSKQSLYNRWRMIRTVTPQ